MPLSPAAQIEAILFFRSEPTQLEVLSSYLGLSLDEIEHGLRTLEENLISRGLVLVRNGSEVSLGTHPDAHALIEAITKEELTRDLGKAGLETLAIILYKGKASKKEIDYIRGVNSGFILRNLLIRGLIKREDHSEDRSFSYTPAIDFLAHLGIANLSQLPDYQSVTGEIEHFLTQSTTVGEANPEENTEQ